MLPNKGKVFLDILQNHSYADCVKQIVGEEFLVSSFGANIAKPGEWLWIFIQINGGFQIQ